MKKFLKNIVVIIYLFISLAAIGGLMGMLLVCGMSSGPQPYWIFWILVPLVIVVIASQEQVFNWIAKNDEHEEN